MSSLSLAPLEFKISFLLEQPLLVVYRALPRQRGKQSFCEAAKDHSAKLGGIAFPPKSPSVTEEKLSEFYSAFEELIA